MKALADLVAKAIKRVPPDRRRWLILSARWSELCGERLARVSRPRIEGRTVVVEVEDERWAEQIRGLGDLMRSRLDAAVGGVDRVEVEGGHRILPPPPAAEPASPLPAAVTLSPGLESAVEGIADSDLRERFRRLAGLGMASGRGNRLRGPSSGGGQA